MFTRFERGRPVPRPARRDTWYRVSTVIAFVGARDGDSRIGPGAFGGLEELLVRGVGGRAVRIVLRPAALDAVKEEELTWDRGDGSLARFLLSRGRYLSGAGNGSGG